jgi:uncharacterized phage infection (PIP) family protein YhgE
MGNISRILAVASAVLSVAFFGFALVTTQLGGPNWQSEAAQLQATPQDSGGYVFTYTRGENAQWTASSTTGDFTKSAKVLPDVVVAAYDDKIRTQQEQVNALNEELPQLQERTVQMDAAIAADLNALQQARAQREGYLEQLRAQYTTLSQQVVQKTEEGQQIEQVIEARRTDVFRLENQLQVLRADDARIEQIEQQMLDLIRQIDADLAKAERRQSQLEQRVGEEAPTGAESVTQPGQ